MKFRIYIIISVVLLLSPSVVKAQSDFDLSQRFFNEAIYNPAATGNSFTTTFFLHLRNQWIGMEGAPTTEVFSVDSFLERYQSAVGLTITGDQIGKGSISTYSARAAYAFYIPFNDKSLLSLGVSAAVVCRKTDPTGNTIEELPDPLFKSNTKYSPDFDFGVEYQGAFKVGVAVRHLGKKPTAEQPYDSKNIWAYASSRFNLMHHVSIEPMISYIHRDRINRYEFGALLYFLKSSTPRYYNDRFWVGAMYRINQQYSVMAGCHITPKIRIGYSFDYGLGDLGLISKKGTHEIFIAWQFNRLFYKDKRMDCPAYKRTDYDDKAKKDRMENLYYQFY